MNRPRKTPRVKRPERVAPPKHFKFGMPLHHLMLLALNASDADIRFVFEKYEDATDPDELIEKSHAMSADERKLMAGSILAGVDDWEGDEDFKASVRFQITSAYPGESFANPEPPDVEANLP